MMLNDRTRAALDNLQPKMNWTDRIASLILFVVGYSLLWSVDSRLARVAIGLHLVYAGLK